MDYRTIKRELRKMGVAHGDAAAFIRVYKKIRQKRKSRMVKDIMATMEFSGMPVLDLGRRQIGRMYAEHWASAEQLERTAYENLEGRFRLEVARRLADEMVHSNAVTWTQRAVMKGDQQCYVLRGALEVVLPEEEDTEPRMPKGHREFKVEHDTQMEPWSDFWRRW